MKGVVYLLIHWGSQVLIRGDNNVTLLTVSLCQSVSKHVLILHGADTHYAKLKPYQLSCACHHGHAQLNL